MSWDHTRRRCMICKKPLGPLEGRLLGYMDRRSMLRLIGEICVSCADENLERREGEEEGGGHG